MNQTNIIIALVVFCIIIGFALSFQDKKKYNLAPKKIWTYWDNPDKIPKIVKMCIEGWTLSNPNYEIILLTKKNFKGYVTIPDEIRNSINFQDNPARFSDLVRLWTLAEHGGIWVDASILLKVSLDEWLFPKYAEFSGFYIDMMTKQKEYPIIESWFFACNKDSKFVKLWRDEFSKIALYPNIEKYLESRKEMGVDYEKISNPHYLAIHVAAQKILQIDKYPLDSLILQRAEDGPFKYLVDAKWDPEKGLRLACDTKSYQAPIMKIRSDERVILDKLIDSDLSLEKCGWI
jgi:hypothetical protein